jgi:hypothetical protein
MSDVTDKREIDSNGYIEIPDNPISQVGVYPYLGSMIGGKDPAKIYYVLRSAEELSRSDTLDSLRLMPIVDDHEMLGEGETPAEKKGVHGVVGEKVYFDTEENQVKGNLKIHSTSLIDKIDNQGKKELSAGYRADHEFMPGTFNGEDYDAIQKNIIFNHVALVDRGRMGSGVSVLDQDDISLITTTQPQHENRRMNHLEKLQAVYEALGAFLGEEAAEPENKEAEVMDEEEPETEEKKEEPVEEDAKNITDAAIEKIVNKKVAMALGNVSKRDELYEKLKPHTGVMDSAQTMTLDELAAYGVSKLGLECPKGQETAALQGYFAGIKSHVQDGQDFIDRAYKSNKPSLSEFE